MRSMSRHAQPGRRSPVWISVRLGLAIAIASGALHAQEAGLQVTVINEKTGETRTGLGAENFSIKDGSTPLRVHAVRELRGPVDILMLVDTSIVGEPVRPLAEALIEELREDEMMAIVGYDEGAELLQDFTSGKQSLRKAMDTVEYGNVPRVHDALFASIDSGFELSTNRRAIVLLSGGAVAGSRTPESEVLERSRAKRVSIYSVFVRTDARNLLRRFAARTGGASFAARQLKLDPRELADLVLEAVRNPYELSVSGVYSLGDRIAVTVSESVRSKAKLTASALPLE